MPRARYKQVVDTIADEIRSGRWRAGLRLPTHRDLARQHSLALATASRVYAELESMGLVIGETGRGTFVRETSLPHGLGIDQQRVADDMVDLNFNYPSLPGQAELLRSALRHLSTAGDLDALLRYQPHGGRLRERDTIAQHLTLRELQVDSAHVLIVDGAQHGLAATAMALLKTGDVVVTDALTYPGIKVLAQTLGLELASIPSQIEGPDIDALEDLCAKKRRVRAIYVQPTVHNPLGWVMGLRRRQQLVAMARRHGLLIIEDAPYAFLEEHAPPALAALAPDLTVYVSGFSKSVATGLRVGFVVAPGVWIPRIERAIRATTWNTPGVMTAIVSRWIEDGTVARLELEKRQDARCRQTIAAEVFQGFPHVGHPASYFTWLPLPEAVRAELVAKELIDHGISVSTAEPFSTSLHVPHAIRIALGSVDPQTLRTALGTVRAVIEDHAWR